MVTVYYIKFKEGSGPRKNELESENGVWIVSNSDSYIYS